MAKLPEAFALGQRPSPEPLGRAFHLADERPEQSGAAIAGIGEAVAKIGEELGRARQATALSDSLGKAAQELTEKALEFSRDQDYKTSPQRFKSVADEIG